MQSGHWVMEGAPTMWNYIMSGKWQPGFGNQFAYPWEVKTYLVPKSSLKCPSGKGIDGSLKLIVPAKQKIFNTNK